MFVVSDKLNFPFGWLMVTVLWGSDRKGKE